MAAMSAKKWLQRGVPVVVSIGSITWLLGSIDSETLIGALNWRIAAILLPSLLAYGAVSLAIEAASILTLVDPRPPGFGLWVSARIKSASYLVGIVNYALGGVALTVLLRKRARIGVGESASIVLLIAAIDMIVVLSFATLSGVSAGDDAPAIRAGIVALAGLGFFGGMALLRAPGSLGPLERVRSLAVFDSLRVTPLRRIVHVAALRFAFSVLFVSLAGITFYAFGIDIGAGQLIFGMMVIAVVGALPIAVAGLGTGQVTALYVFRGVAPEGELLALSLVLSAGMILLRASMGLFFAREYTREALEESRSTPT
jgi:hypothetical protein